VSLSGPVKGAAAAALVFHTLAVVWIWATHPTASRALILFWSDFPASLLFAGLAGGAYLAASLVVGGALWAFGAGLLAALVGKLARRPSGAA